MNMMPPATSNGQTTQIQESLGTQSYSTAFVYDKDGKLTTLTSAGGSLTHTYDSLGRLVKTTRKSGAILKDTTYTYQAGVNGSTSNLVATVTDPDKTTSYTYDANGNIKTITSAGNLITYTYNEISELIREDNQVLNKTITYRYDVGGNLLEKKEYAYTTGTPGAPTRTTPYSYADTNWKDKLTSFDGKAITYDAIGNPLNFDGWTYTWEEGRQLKTLAKTSTSLSFKYNSSGLRTEKSVNGVPTKYIYLGGKVAFETNGAETFHYTYDGNGVPFSMTYNGSEYFYLTNVQGDVTGLVNASGATVVSYTYDSWGKLILTDGSMKDTLGVKNPYRYRGYRYDTETGHYYLQSRYYNPEIGRFINADVAEVLDGGNDHLLENNLFSYCTNNPVNNFDNTGKWKISNWAKITIGAVAILATGAITAATGGLAAPAIIGALQVAGYSAASGSVIGAVKGLITKGKKGIISGAIDGAANGFMWGGLGAAGETFASKILSKVIFNGNGGYGFKLGKRFESMYQNPSKRGGTIISDVKTKFRIDLDPYDGLHAHWGKGKAAKSIHRSLYPWNFGKPKKFW